jgi:putative ABC transport system permease protein
MIFRDSLRLALGALRGYRMRSFLTALGIAVGVASVVLLTSLGKGVQNYVLAQFTQFGTNIIGIAPGREITEGISLGGVISNVRPLSINDALALTKVPQVIGVVPVVEGNAAVEFGRRSRRTLIIGAGPDVPEVWNMMVATGRFLPNDDPRNPRAFVVIGSKIREELFGSNSPLGKRIRVGGERYMVIGEMESKGQMLGFDLDDAVYIPAQRAMEMFDNESLAEIDLVYSAGSDSETVVRRVKQVLSARHGSEDFTIVTQEQMMDVLGSILDVLTLAVGALGAISLLVGGVGILTIMTIAVNERTAEIGLLRALGAGQRQVLLLFLGEAVALASIGGLVGLIIGAGGAWLIGAIVPALPTHTPWSYVLLSEGSAALIGLLSGILPARRAARLDPIQALRAE